MHPTNSPRLHFRTWTEADLPLALALWGDEDVMRHMGGARSVEAATERFHSELAVQRDHGFQYWPIFHADTGQHAGCAGLRPFHNAVDVLEVGVHIARPFWSGRYGEEAARTVIAHAWQHTNATALVAGHGPDNAASHALIQRLGFTYTHHEVWGPQQRMHPYYRLQRPAQP